MPVRFVKQLRKYIIRSEVTWLRQIPEYQLVLARDLRQRQTANEARVWVHLRGKKLAGVKFRRQRPLGRYIADFCCDAAKLVIEIDGSVHAVSNQQEYDKIRDDILTASGYTVLRITNDEIDANLQLVLSRIAAAISDAV